MRIAILFTAIILLGAGCVRNVPIDDTPGSNPENCLSSGGTLIDGVCVCPEGSAADPADFCLNAAGLPGKLPPSQR